MFENAIKDVSEFTRPIYAIYRKFGSNDIRTKAGTLFFVNELGDAITTLSTIENFLGVEANNHNYKNYKTEKSKIGINEVALEDLNNRYGYSLDSIVELKTLFIDCFHGSPRLEITADPNYNLALLRFTNTNGFGYKGFARFIKGAGEQLPGKHLCRLGYPFPQFTNYEYNEILDEINWKAEGEIPRVLFPIEGIITRLISDGTPIAGFEISTPGYEGHEGSPVFDSDGTIYGIHLGNAIIPNIQQEELNERLTPYPPALFGECIHAQTVKQFLKTNNVKFYETGYDELIVNDEVKTEREQHANPFPFNMIPTSFIASDQGEAEMIIHSVQVERDGITIVDYQNPLRLTTGKVDPGSRTGGASLVQFSTEGKNTVFVKEEGASRTNHLEENQTYKLGVQQRKLSSGNWKVKASVKTQARFPFEYFDLLIIRRHGRQRDHITDPHIAFYPDGGGKYIRFDEEKNIKINTTKIIEQLNPIVLPQETSIKADEFEIKLWYAFDGHVLSIVKIELLDK